MRAPAYLPAYTDRKGFWTLDGDAIRWLDVVLFAATGALRIWPVFVLGLRFSGLVAIQPGHKLVTSGVYTVPSPQLSGAARQLAGVGARFSEAGFEPSVPRESDNDFGASRASCNSRNTPIDPSATAPRFVAAGVRPP